MTIDLSSFEIFFSDYLYLQFRNIVDFLNGFLNNEAVVIEWYDVHKAKNSLSDRR
jgi:hypothetical protein